MSGRRAAAYLALLVAAAGFLLFTAPGRGLWIIDPDAAAYVGLARSMVGGEGYTLQGVPHAKFPPGFPLLLAFVMRVTGDPECYAAMRDAATVMGLATILLSFAVARRLLALAPGPSLLVALATATSIYLVQYSVAYLRSETTFTTFFLLALLAGNSWRERGGAGRALLAGLAAGAATAVRSAGIAGIAAIALARFLSRDPGRKGRTVFSRAALLETALFCAVAMAPMFAHREYVSHRSEQLGIESTDYGDELLAAYALDLTKDIDVSMPKIGVLSAEMAQRVKGNLAALALSLGKFVVNHNKGANLATRAGTLAMHPGAFVLLLLLAIGWIVAWRRGLAVVAIVTLVYLGLYLIWPFNQQQRFYQPLAPVLLVLLAFGAAPLLRLALRILERPAGRIVGVAAAWALFAGLASRRSSVDTTVLGRWSIALAVILASIFLLAVLLTAFALIARRQAVDLGRHDSRVRAIAFTGLALLWVGSFLNSFRELQAEQREFEASRRARPVSERFARIKTDPELIALLERLVAEARPGDLVMSDIPKMIHEMTGLPTTPLRFSSATNQVVLDTPSGRPRFLYYSPEIEQVLQVFQHVLAGHPRWLVPLHEVTVKEGDRVVKLALYRVLDE